MSDPSTYWLNFTNIALGVVVLICCVAVAIGVVQELAARRKKATRMSEARPRGGRPGRLFQTATRSTSPDSASPWPMAAKSSRKKEER